MIEGIYSLEETPGEIGLVAPQDFHYEKPFCFACGQSIPGFTLRYETYGQLNAARDNAILICHALSGDHHCSGIHSLDDRKPGWWNEMVGPGKPVDTRRWFVICSNVLGGCQGSTGPSSLNPATGRAYGIEFPALTVADMVRAQHLLLTEGLGLATLWATIGGSMGGMQVLQWAVDFPGFVQRTLALATTARQSAQAIAFDEVGRCAIMQDADWEKGAYPPSGGPRVGLSIARMMAHITYLSDQGLEEKFGRTRRKEATRNLFDVEFEVESYLRYQGRSFLNRFDANTYLYLTKALDRFDLFAPTGCLEDTFASGRGRFLIVGFSSDWLYTPEQNRTLARALLRAGKEASYAEINLALGHDSFLVHSPDLHGLVREFLEAP